MPTTPHRLQLGTSTDDAYALINDNFDKAVQNLSDLGANVTTATLVTLTIPATSTAARAVSVISPGTLAPSAFYVTTTSIQTVLNAIAPQVDIYIDTDNVPGNLWPLGANINAGMFNFFPSVTINATSVAGTLASYSIQINNRDTAQHIYYIHTRAGYLPSGSIGNFR